ncbi:MAG: sugar phosphate nucleotidyltransferase [Candidatus Thalassarchaeum sp.]
MRWRWRGSTSAEQGPVLVLNGDLISSVDVAALAAHHTATGAKATLSLWEVEDPSRFGVCDLDESGMIGRFQEKPEPGTEFSNLINAGCYLIERDVLSGLSSDKHSMEREVFPRPRRGGRDGRPRVHRLLRRCRHSRLVHRGRTGLHSKRSP